MSIIISAWKNCRFSPILYNLYQDGYGATIIVFLEQTRRDFEPIRLWLSLAIESNKSFEDDIAIHGFKWL